MFKHLHGARLTALYVIDPYPYLGVGASNPVGFQDYMRAAQEHAATSHAKVSDRCNTSGPAVTHHARLVENVGAANGIIETAKAEGADLIVVGSHGRSGVVRMVLESVAARVVAQAPVPVLVAR